MYIVKLLRSGVILAVGVALTVGIFSAQDKREAQSSPTTISIIKEVEARGFSDAGAGGGLERDEKDNGRLIAFNVLARVGPSRHDETNPMRCMAVITWTASEGYALKLADSEMKPTGPILLKDPTNAKAQKLSPFADCK